MASEEDLRVANEVVGAAEATSYPGGLIELIATAITAARAETWLDAIKVVNESTDVYAAAGEMKARLASIRAGKE